MKKLFIAIATLLICCGCGAMSPSADAGTDQTVAMGETVTLSSAGSDQKNGDNLSYSWYIVSAPAGSKAQLSATNVAEPSFTPDKVGDYVFELVVNNDYWDSEPAVVKLTCTQAPSAVDASGQIRVTELTPVENFRNATHVNFSIKISVSNTKDTRVNIGIPIFGKNADGATIFTRSIDVAINPDQTQQWNISYGEPLTIAEYDSITTWTGGEIVIY